MSCLGQLTSLSFSYYAGSVDVTGTHDEDMMMTLHRNFSAHVSTGESACGGLVDRVLFQPMRRLVIAD